MDWLADVCPLRRRCASAAHWRVSGIVLGMRLVPGLGLGRRDSYRYQSLTLDCRTFEVFPPPGLLDSCASLGLDAIHLNRDTGKLRGSPPPTPPDMRVRIRRFGELSNRFHS